MDGVIVLGTSQNGTTQDNGNAPRKNVDTGVPPLQHTPPSDSSPPLSEEELLLAATLVRDAAGGYNMHYEADIKSIRSYQLYNHIGFKVALHVCLWGNLLLAVFEKPAVHPVGIPYWGTMILEIFFLSYFMFRLLHNSSFSTANIFWRDPKNLTVLIIEALTVIDIVAYCIWVNTTPGGEEVAVRWSRPLRPFLIINFPEGRQVRKAFRNIRRTLPDIAYVLLLFLASIALFALLGLKLMMNKQLEFPDGSEYFRDYWESFWSLYVLVTTANNPDIMMPAYDNNKWYALFFMVYLIVNLYIFMNIVLAVIYNNYKKHLKNEVKSNVYCKRQRLSRAFTILRICGPGGRELVPADRWLSLMKLVDPKRSATELTLLLHVLDTTGEGNIDKGDFLKVGDLLNVELKVVDVGRNAFERLCPRLYSSYVSKLICSVVTTKYFQWAFDLMILTNAVFIGLSIDAAEWFFLAIFIVEIILRIYANGPIKYFRSFWNIFDFFIITLSVIITIVDSALHEADERTTILDVLMILRILRLVRLAGSFERFRIVLVTIVNIGPSIATYGAIIFVIYYFYAVIGVEAFQGLIRYTDYSDLTDDTRFCGNSKLEGSEFYNKRYCSNNFNNILHAFVVLFELMVVNQWHVIAEGFVLVTHKAARIYFISFHLLCVVVILNIFTAFILEIFILEYTLSKSTLEATVEQRIKDMGLGAGQKVTFQLRRRATDQEVLVDEGGDDSSSEQQDPPVAPPDADISHRFKLSERGSRNVETLLQLMFEGEIEATDEGLTYNSDSGDENSPPVTFNNLF